MTKRSPSGSARSSAIRAVVTIAVGYVLAGPAGMAAAAAVALTARRLGWMSHLIAPALLLAAAVATIVEAPTNPGSIATFARDRPVAHALGLAAAAAWLTGVVIAPAARRERTASGNRAWPFPPRSDRVGHVATKPATAIEPGSGQTEARSEVARHIALLPATTILAVGATGWWVHLWPFTMFVVFAWLATVAAVSMSRLTHWLASIGGRLASREGEHQLLTGSAWLVAGTAVISAGSFLYWLVAARLAGKDAVGNASAMFTACFLLALLASPGMVVTVSRFGTGVDRRPTAVYAWSLLVSVAGAMVTAIAFVSIGPGRVDDALDGLHPVLAAALLAIVIACLSASNLVDVRLMGRREWHWLFARHAAITVVRFAGIPFISTDDGGRSLFLLAIGAFAITGLPFLPVTLRSSTGWPRLGDLRDDVATIARFAATNSVSQLAIQGTALLAPLTILAWETSERFAEFYIAWGIMSVVFAGIQLVTQILLVEGSRKQASRDDQLRTTLRVTLGGAVVASIAAVPFQAIVPFLYGDDFAATSRLILPLMLGTVPWAITAVALTATRINTDNRRSILLSLVFAVGVTGGVMAGTLLGGTIGAAIGWLAGSTVAAGVAWRGMSWGDADRAGDADSITPVRGAREVTIDGQ